METPTIVRQTKHYMLVKISLPRQVQIGASSIPRELRTAKMNRAEKRLWGIIHDGEREYQTGKTIRARSIDEALKNHVQKEARQKNAF